MLIQFDLCINDILCVLSEEIYFLESYNDWKPARLRTQDFKMNAIEQQDRKMKKWEHNPINNSRGVVSRKIRMYWAPDM